MDNSALHQPCHPRPCFPGQRCGNWRECDPCARIRQARIADAAERLAGLTGEIHWTTLEPINPGAAALRAARAAWLDAAKPAGAIWTVERSPRSGNLHCNILTPPGLPPPSPLAYQHRITRVLDPRATAAYISKRTQIPPREQYPGRTYGTAGPLWQFLSRGDQLAPVQAAAVQMDINRHAGHHPDPPRAPPIYCAADLDRTDYRAILARRLPDIVSTFPLPRRQWHPRDGAARSD